jgi:hypothetical protein
MIDDTAFIVAANTATRWCRSPAAARRRATPATASSTSDQKPIDNLRALLTSCRGFLVFSGGQYKLKIDKAETPVSLTLSEDNIIGSWSVSLGSKRTRYNRVKARFFNPSASVAAGHRDPGLERLPHARQRPAAGSLAARAALHHRRLPRRADRADRDEALALRHRGDAHRHHRGDGARGGRRGAGDARDLRLEREELPRARDRAPLDR